ncbi:MULTISPECIES: electron transport complex subunit RsxC [unclassified Guyparkeria]|uniref:electron transport complex subunit RsxC n=1 Tax=unclassified Guyparkeria TaxID=2626246 RepID=UPI00073349B7|nr:MULTISPECIES: electron transport complex subunit RsxC [unclassified Guyparkeria]KTG17287.1 electron transporter RnfC [Guyparkeria sp. XI15]OAE87264.1 electron transport complex subunit RsxC [Guyparkeria sp. WRN-7]
MPEARATVSPGLHGFHGGLDVEPRKAPACDRPIGEMPLVDEYVLPLHMHIGAPAIPVVSVGDHVRRGQLLARPDDFISAAIHAPTSGVIKAIEPRGLPHPGGLSAQSIVLAADGEDRAADPFPPWPDYEDKSPVEIRSRLREAGIVGLGGAVFPTAVKLATANPGGVETLVLNGAECEPYISCDDRLMQEAPETIIRGAQMMLHAVGAARCLIGIEDNKPRAVEALQAVIDRLAAEENEDRFAIKVVPSIYPAGGEKQLIRTLTGIEVPRNRHVTDYQLLCLNVGTVANSWHAVVEGRALTERVVTVTGGGVAEPQNFRVRIGTPMAKVIEAAGGYTEGVDRLLMGGPMMGFALHEDEVPVVKATNCLLAMRPVDRDPAPAPQPCIRCSRCSEACPADLLPQQLYWYARAQQFDRSHDYHLFDCIECGVCSAVCPSHIPLVQYFRHAKTEIWSAEREKAKAEHARRRFEFHNERIERQKAEREAALAKKRAAVKAAQEKAAAEDADGDKAGGKAAKPEGEEKSTAAMSIEAARARAKARKARVQRGEASSDAPPANGEASDSPERPGGSS